MSGFDLMACDRKDRDDGMSPEMSFHRHVSRTVWHAVFVLILTTEGNLFAQTKGSSSLAGLVLSEISALDAAPDLAVWRSLHPNELLKKADYDNEYETQGLWCAASVAEFTFPGGLTATRQAFFYVPSGKPGNPMPGHEDRSLLRQCRLLALWYEVDNPTGPVDLAKTVSSETQRITWIGR